MADVRHSEPRPRREGRERAESVRYRHQLGDAPIRGLFSFIERHWPDVLVVRYPMPGGPAGALVRTGFGWLLIVNTSQQPLARQRFTAAHLLGHVLLDGERVSLHIDTQLPGANAHAAAAPAEMRADAFALQLLLPIAALSSRLNGDRFGLSEEGLVALALDFGLCMPSLSLHLAAATTVDDGDRRRIAAIDVPRVATRVGLAERVRQESIEAGVTAWPRRYLALAAQAWDRQLVDEPQLRAFVGEDVAQQIVELGGGRPDRRQARWMPPTSELGSTAWGTSEPALRPRQGDPVDPGPDEPGGTGTTP